MVFDFSPFAESSHVVVHCPEERLAEELFREIKRCYPDIAWLTDDTLWDEYEEETGYYIPLYESGHRMEYSRVGWYSSHGYKVVSIYSIMQPVDIGEFSASEVDIKSLLGME